jgi:L-lactate dehydrogenase
MKIGIIGTGWVGSSVAISVLHSGIAEQLLLHDARGDVAQGEAMDLAHGGSFYPSARVDTADPDQMRDCDAVVVTAGKGGGPDDTRLDLLKTNAKIIRDIGEQLRGSTGLIVVVTNPVDVLTAVMTDATGLPPHRVIGTGTMLDTARLRHDLGRRLNLDPRSIHAQVLGEHGDSSVIPWSTAHLAGRPLRSLPDWDRDAEPKILDDVRTAAYRIIEKKGSTNHAIGLVTAALLRWTLRGQPRVLTVTRLHHNTCGIDNVALSLPTTVGPDGAAHVIEPQLDDAERGALHHSAAVLHDALGSVK